jgi:MoaA/NifB/PqqE/SkfB family radical SAM enzyme
MRILPIPHYFPTLAGWLANAVTRRTVFPFYASFKITSRCQFACPFCSMPQRPTEDLDTATVKKILDNLSGSSILLTSFEGGEPLLRPDIGELLKYAATRRFYLLFTTSARDLLDHPLREYGRWIDFFHVSIDEGHDNLEMFETVLPELTSLHSRVSVQTVVTDQTLDALPEKVRQCHRYKASMVIMPAATMDGVRDCFPDMGLLRARVRSLNKAYPRTILTMDGYFQAYQARRCSAASIIIDSDGFLFYPCHIRGDKGPNLAETDLRSWLRGRSAIALRAEMKACDRNCGWCQYYAIGDYTRIGTVLSALRPVFQKR